jgi:hypothetical protein
MPELNLFQIFTSRLNKMGMRYMVTGAVASIIYGEPRLTYDIDVVIELKSEQSEKIGEAFPSDQFYCPPMEIVRLEAERPLRGHFNIIHHETGLKADFYTMGKDKLHSWGMSNRKRIDLEGEPLWLAPVEYVILRKLEYYREGESEKHLQDIISILEISSDQINFQQLEEKIQENALQKEWDKVKRLTKG